LARAAATVAAFFILAVGVVPMASAADSAGATPIVTEAVNGTPNLVNTPAPGFTLTDQYGKPVSLSSLRGKAVALTFLDPVCTSDCPLIAQSFRRADQLLGGQSSKTLFIAVVANPLYRSVTAVDTFDRQEDLDGVSNWLFLTGSLPALTKVWNRYGVTVQSEPAGAMIDHSDVAYVIDPQGRMRAVLGSDPGTGTTSQSSFSSLVAQELRGLLP
jgi:cytochrome oxidase Cu insertion factor (SCO1/SenC/PrrC family)